MEHFSSGERYLFGDSAEALTPQQREAVYFVSESIYFDLPMTVQDLIPLHENLYRHFDTHYFLKILESLRLDIYKKLDAFSRGGRMQVTLALGLSIKPKLLVLDEITAVLDAQARAYLVLALSEFVSRGGTVILASNIVSEAQDVCSHIIMLQRGELRLHVSLSEMNERFIKLKSKNALPLERLDSLARTGFVAVHGNRDHSTSFVASTDKRGMMAEYPDLEFDKRSVTAEDVFVYFSTVLNDLKQ